MRHYPTVKAALFLSFFLASSALADDAADRSAIDHIIARLNQRPFPVALFTNDSDALLELQRLPKVEPIESRLLMPPADHPTVEISHEPWGEATINLSSRPPVVESVNPRIAGGDIRLITPDVVLADGAWTYKNATGAVQAIPLFFVMKKEGDNWKIAALRTVTPR